MSTPPPSYAEVPPKLLGGALCLDFVNTVGWRGRSGAERTERLTAYEELIHWERQAGALREGDARTLLAEARRSPAQAARVLEEAVELREAIARLVVGSPRHRPADLARVNRLLNEAPARTALAATDGGYRWATEPSGRELERPLWPILWSAADLLTSERREWVRRCGDEECGWIFLDASPASTRVWCSMQGCGNRAKARRHSQRTRAAKRTG